MCELNEKYSSYDFAGHKGYVTPEHNAALLSHGPCAEHRRRFINVRRAASAVGLVENMPQGLEAGDDLDMIEEDADEIRFQIA